MEKKKSCQELKVPRPLDAAEARLYGWVEETVLTQPSVVESDSLPEFRRNFPLMEDSGAEGDYVLEAAGPSDRVPFRAGEGGSHLLWKDVMTRCRVAVSQLHLNGWGFILAFEKVCLHYGFRPTIRLFFYIYDVHFPPGGYGYISFRARQGRKLFDSYEDSIQEFKWHYFKVLAASGKRAFWLDHEDKPFSWVYWNPEVKDFTVYNLEPLEMAAFKFLVSLPGSLPKRNKFTSRWILDGSDTEVGKFLDDLLDVKMKKTKLDNLMAMMANPSRMGPQAVLPTSSPSATATAAAAAAAASASVVTGSTPVESSSQVVNLEGEEGLQEDPAADLQQKRQKKKAKVDDAFEKALGEDSAWEHDVDPLQVAFPESFNYRKALNAGLTSAPVGVETSLAVKVKAEKELSAALDQIEVLKGERDSTLVYLPLKEKIDEFDDQLSERTVEYRSALDRIALLEEDNKFSLEGEKKRPETAEKQAGSLATLLKTCQADVSKATEASEYWCSEWQQLGTEVTVMCQETLDICLDQVSHHYPGVNFSAITLKSRWDPKGRRLFRSSIQELPLRLRSRRPETWQELVGNAPLKTSQHRVISPVRCRGVCSDHFIGCPLG
ncbi:hypothetical protein PIB30_052216 [Stylosanthes scabra]|uniref:Uncharacterized protein n=1 Tax=Stylosanthes scabra TaxID=79078 RepID=A0ABU6ZGX7_9FABA|nr:hypothetical protein [Stylosanthes scabra]